MSPRARWIRRLVGLLIILVIGYAVATVVSLVFFPVESDDPPPTPVTVSSTITPSQP